ncbi:MAG: hypothetical protein EOO88_36930 [Pedobacter sp.]|nr:MAG: hypothetical protein EOO88_36930 [Pedobacter sp.]
MGFIKNALIGIALYEGAKYLLSKQQLGFDPEMLPSPQSIREEHDIIAGARQTDHLTRMQENAATSSHLHEDSDDFLKAGTNPETPLTGYETASDKDDPWKKSLANDDLRAPDS